MIGSPSSVAEIVAHLQSLRSQENIAGMARYGIATDGAIGISNPDLQKIARRVGRNHGRALDLWRTGIREARMLAIYTADPAALTPAEVRAWSADFASWEIVDAAADLLTETPFWRELIAEFSGDDREFVRRAAFSMIAGATVHNKREPDETFIAYLPLIEAHADDPRNFVKKAVNWALRNIGKRSRNCHGPALALSQKLATSVDKTARWIGKDAVKELSGEKVLARLKG
ncbi:DNA alkylation repair protein [Rhizobium puerariae]|uniref:DNA alkylation repair protein n=1 Tax=Rhizobium puerariae TaxID=1585791 RepID=A0ABV6AS07_9HYPH